MSRPARGKLLLVMSFVLTLCAGIVVGMGLSKQVIAGPTTPPIVHTQPASAPNPGSWFVKELSLTPDQSEQMKTIWSQAMEGPGRELFDVRRNLYRDRDKAIEALYTDEQRSERERLKKDYELKLADNSKEREKVVQAAVEKTKAMLNEQQRVKYEQMMREKADRDRDRHRGPPTRSSTQPSERQPGSPPSFGPGPGFPSRRGGDEGRGGDGHTPGTVPPGRTEGKPGSTSKRSGE